MTTIIGLKSGGQSGADRGAMDAARWCGVPVSGWSPKGGWAEDYPEPPGVLALYPEMRETPSSEVLQRTEWNIRDSDCCIVLNTCNKDTSPGTDAGYAFYEKYSKPYFEITLNDTYPIDEQIDQACAWLEALGNSAVVVGVGGPRESEYPCVYDIAFDIVVRILRAFAE